MHPKCRYGESRDVPSAPGRSRASGYAATASSRKRDRRSAAGRSPDGQASVCPRPKGRKEGAEAPPTAGKRARAKAAGSCAARATAGGGDGCARHRLQNGVKTRKGPPEDDRSDSGGKSTPSSNRRASKPSPRRPASTFPSRAANAGSRTRLKNTASAWTSLARPASVPADGPRLRTRRPPLAAAASETARSAPCRKTRDAAPGPHPLPPPAHGCRRGRRGRHGRPRRRARVCPKAGGPGAARRRSPAPRSPPLMPRRRPGDQGPGLLLDSPQVVGPEEAFGVDLVDVLRAGRAGGEPAVRGDHLQPPDGGAVPGRDGEHLHDRLARQRIRRHLRRGQARQKLLLLPVRRRVDPFVRGRAELLRQLRVQLAGVAAGARRHLGRQKPEDQAVLVRAPCRAVHLQERRPGALLPAEAEVAGQKPRDEPLEPDGDLDQPPAETGRHPSIIPLLTTVLPTPASARHPVRLRNR